MKYKIGIDVGGTFTDFFLVSDKGDFIMHKTLSTPKDSSEGFITGLKEIAEILNLLECAKSGANFSFKAYCNLV